MTGGEVAVIGLGASGRAVATLLARHGRAVYASDGSTTDEVRAAGAALSGLGVVVDVGRHDLERIAHATLVVASPGVPPSAPPRKAAEGAAVPIVSEVEVALGYLPGVRYIAVTGTNGKTTTTALVGHLLRGLGERAVDAGNIGRPLADVALSPALPTWVALELSSFQLHDTPSVDPAVGVLTNLSPDHLDRYTSAAAYYADKARMFRNASRRSVQVVNADDRTALELTNGLPGRRVTFSVAGAIAEAGYDRQQCTLDVLGEPLIGRPDLPLLGDHNVANALAAALAVATADDSYRTAAARSRMRTALRTFRGLPHRLQVVGVYDGVEWIDDSKATNVSSTLVALRGMTRPAILLLGGRHKGEPYTALIEAFGRHGKVVLAYGEAAPLIVRDLAADVPVEQFGSDFAAVVTRARAVAVEGDVVLLSPACSSFDMFRNYEDRGETFARLAVR